MRSIRVLRVVAKELFGENTRIAPAARIIGGAATRIAAINMRNPAFDEEAAYEDISFDEMIDAIGSTIELGEKVAPYVSAGAEKTKNASKGFLDMAYVSFNAVKDLLKKLYYFITDVLKSIRQEIAKVYKSFRKSKSTEPQSDNLNGKHEDIAANLEANARLIELANMQRQALLQQQALLSALEQEEEPDLGQPLLYQRESSREDQPSLSELVGAPEDVEQSNNDIRLARPGL